MKIIPAKFNLMTKLSLLVTFAVLLVLVILGFYFDNFLKDRFLDDTQQRMQRGFQRLAYNLKYTEQELRDGITLFATDEKMLASIALIGNYQDKRNYNAFLIDEEKKIIASELLKRVKLSFNSNIVLYDPDGELIAYVSKGETGYQLNFVSFEEGLPRLYRRNESEATYSPVLRPLGEEAFALMRRDVHPLTYERSGSIVTFQRQNDDVVIKSHLTLFREDSGQTIAHVEMSKILDRAYFDQFSNDINIHIGPSFDRKYGSHAQRLDESWSVPAIDIMQSDQEYVGALEIMAVPNAVYFVARMDKQALNAALNENRRDFFVMLVLVALATLVLMRYVIRGSLERPLTKLMAQIRKIENSDYSPSHLVATGDELQDISSNVNHLAQAVAEREGLLEKARSEQEYLSNHDALTNLPNRRYFSQRLQQALDTASRNGTQLAIMFLDLDQFKQVNDTLGHVIGDQLLIQVAQRLLPRGTDQLLARIGGDEFIVLIDGVGNAKELKAIAEQYLALFSTPFLCAGMELGISASIGVAMYPKDGNDSVTLIKHADLAMYKSKDRGRNSFSFYSDELAEYMQNRADLTQALKLAIETGDQFELYYQPKIAVATGQIHAVEALIRWHSPGFGNVRPDQFIRIAEETGLIVPIGKWILQRGCSDFVRLQQEGIALEHISINLSNVQLRNDDMVAALRQVIASCGIAPRQIELEITESFIAGDVSNALQVLHALRDMGVSLSIDDFGTGYSSMSYLKKLPVTRVKIDKSFIDGLPHNQDSVTLTRAIIALARNFGLSTTAEGVENEAQRLFLEQEKCDEIQGYFYAKPLSLDQLREFYRTTTGKPAGNVIHLPNSSL
ncbi:MAG TPA: EAL domain-containing protein [Gallionella sp.]